VEPELHKVSFKRSGHSAVLEAQLVLDKVRRKRREENGICSRVSKRSWYSEARSFHSPGRIWLVRRS